MCLFPLNPQRENQLGKPDDKWQLTLGLGGGGELGAWWGLQQRGQRVGCRARDARLLAFHPRFYVNSCCYLMWETFKFFVTSEKAEKNILPSDLACSPHSRTSVLMHSHFKF